MARATPALTPYGFSSPSVSFSPRWWPEAQNLPLPAMFCCSALGQSSSGKITFNQLLLCPGHKTFLSGHYWHIFPWPSCLPPAPCSCPCLIASNPFPMRAISVSLCAYINVSMTLSKLCIPHPRCLSRSMDKWLIEAWPALLTTCPGDMRSFNSGWCDLAPMAPSLLLAGQYP